MGAGLMASLMADETFPVSEVFKAFFLRKTDRINIHGIRIFDGGDARWESSGGSVAFSVLIADSFGASVLPVVFGSILVPSLNGGGHVLHEMDFLKEFTVNAVHEVIDKRFVLGDSTFANEDAEMGNEVVYRSVPLFQVFETETGGAFGIDRRECLLDFLLKIIPCSKV